MFHVERYFLKKDPMKDLIQKTSKQLIIDFGITKTAQEDIEESDLLNLLSDQVAYYIAYDLEFLLSSLYRLDISEKKVKSVLNAVGKEPTNVAIAKLILERQKQRIYTKEVYKQAPIEDLDEELKF